VLTIPAIIEGLVYRIGDNITPYDVRTIAGLRYGDEFSLAGTGATGPVTFRQFGSGSDNLQLTDSRDGQLFAITEEISFRYDAISNRAYQVGVIVRRAAAPIQFAANLTVPLYLDRGEATYFSASGATFTLPATYQRGFIVKIIQIGAGVVTFAPDTGATMTNRQSHTKTAGTWAVVFAEVRGNTGGAAAQWVLYGDTGP
jgi:hypothetical protein